MRKNLLGCLFTIICSTAVYAQTNDELLKKGLAYKEARQVKECLSVFQTLLKTDSSNVVYLTNASLSYSRMGNYFTDEKTRMKYFRTGEYLAKKSLKLDQKNAEAHYVMALALGRINEFADSKTKIANSKIIKQHVDEAIKLNPAHAGAFHILGRWNRTIAGFGSIEKMLINTMFGGVPEGATYDGAVNAFTKAIAFEPKYKLHQFELAQTYYDMGKKVNAKIWCEKALAIPDKFEEDKSTDDKCKKLLQEID